MASFLALIDKWLVRRWCYPVQQSALHRKIVDRIRNSLELKVVLQTAVDEVAALLKLDRCIFFWYFKDLQRVQIVCEHLNGSYESHIGHYSLFHFGGAAPIIDLGELAVSIGHAPRPLGLGFVWRQLTQQLPNHLFANCEILDAKSNLLVPVKGRERSIGFIACLSDQSRWWSAAEIEFMQSIAQQLEIAVRQAQLYDKVQRQAQRERLVNQITTQTRQSLDLKTILTKAIAHVLKAMEVDRCLVHLVEDLNDEYDKAADLPQRISNQKIFWHEGVVEVCRSSYCSSIEDFNVDGPIAQWVVRTRQQIAISDIAQDQRIEPDYPNYKRSQIKSSLVVPVKADGTLLAILYLHQCSHIRYWSRDDQKLAQAVADQLAISIKQARLYAQSRRQAAESVERARELGETLRHLQQTQAQLIQSEKMSSLGQMVAGIAHEINNPVSFIYGNIPYVEQYLQSLLRLVDAYQMRCPQTTDELSDLIKEIELDFLIKDLPNILNSMKFGAHRIREIVLSLRNFSRLDEPSCKVADVDQGLDSTLLVLQSHIDPEIAVVRNYSKLPKVECYPQQLNQVFMNLLMNAIEALSQPQSAPKTIALTTECIFDDITSEAWVRITIADNGCGISDDIQPNVFEPFFTTKKTGQGAGLGLTVSYQTIVNQHQGMLSFNSKPGCGSQFVVAIPVKHSDLRKRDRNPYFLSQNRSLTPAPIPNTALETAIAKRDLH